MAYKTLVRPLVEYSSSVWSPYTKSNIARLEMVQRRAARWTLSEYSPYASVTQMLQCLGWLAVSWAEKVRLPTLPILRDHIWYCSHWHASICCSPIENSQEFTHTVIHLQFWAYGSWDSLFPISMSPNCKLMSPNTIFNDKSAILLHPGTRWNKNLCAKDAGCAGNKITAHTWLPSNSIYCRLLLILILSPLNRAMELAASTHSTSAHLWFI